ncbi:hypothetical protein FRC00_001134 [Tulasnella sp. 408]|nr:hypothetical protein FRC00_001134 [Tulasnella sp. 408]
MPSTPTSAINSLPGSPAARMHVMDNVEGKKAGVARPTLNMALSATRKKRPTSSSLSMSVPGPEPTTAVQHHQALAAATRSSPAPGHVPAPELAAELCEQHARFDLALLLAASEFGPERDQFQRRIGFGIPSASHHEERLA